MNMRSPLVWILCIPLAASCLIQKDPGPEGVVSQPPPPQPDAGDPNVQCMNESAECFSLCGAPECALGDHSIPSFVDVPMIWYQPGGSVNNVGHSAPATSTSDPCAAINDASQVIRKRSCAPCHSAGTSTATITHFDYVLDDMTLANHPDNENDGKIMVKPGEPYTSYVYQRIVTGLRGPGAGGMPPDPSSLPAYLGAAAVQANPNIVVYPTAADVTVLYAWILNCMPGATADAYQANYGSGSFGSNPTSGAAGTH